jgi:hypothetical protein
MLASDGTSRTPNEKPDPKKDQLSQHSLLLPEQHTSAKRED